MSTIWEHIPSIALIENRELADKVRRCWDTAIERSVFNETEVAEIPFTMLIPNCPLSLLAHTESVTSCAYAVATDIMAKNPLIRFDLDILVAGGILHDVGKLLEYDRVDGKIVKSEFGKYLRHPISGAALALEAGLPPHVAHIIAAHSKEGDPFPRSLEGNLINHADFINFESYKIVLGVK